MHIRSGTISMFPVITSYEPDEPCQSTGKTTLCDALAKRMGIESIAYVKEVARGVIRNLGLTREHIGMLEMQRAIMKGHLEREELAIQSRCPVVLCDRSAVDPVVYATLTATDDHDAVERRLALTGAADFQKALLRYRRSVFVLLAPIEEWLVDDGFRHVGDQVQVLEIFKTLLSDLGIAYREIDPNTRSLEERVAIVMGLARQ